MLTQSLGLMILVAILCQLLAWTYRQRAEVKAVDQIAKGELVYLRRLTEEAEARTQTQRERSDLAWTGWRRFRVVAIMDETHTVKSFYLAPHDKKSLPPFLPGQHITIQVKPSDRRDPLVRCYSLSSAPNSEFYRISVKREMPRPSAPDSPPGVMSNHLHDMLKEGDFVDLKSPSGRFSLDLSRHTPIVLIGGGIGITPIFSMLDSIVAQNSSREVWFFAGMQSRLDHPLHTQTKSHANLRENVRLIVCYSDPTEGCVLGEDYHHHGFVTVDLLRDILPANNYDFYFCGPPGMMNALHDGLGTWGVPSERMHFEAFGPATVGKPIAVPDQEIATKSFKVNFVRSEKTLKWDHSKGSLLELAEQQGISVDSGCRAGNCGTCMTAIRSGDVNYLTKPGDMPEVGTCLLCTAVPITDLELDA